MTKYSILSIFIAFFLGAGLATWVNKRNSVDESPRIKQLDSIVVIHKDRADSLQQVTDSLQYISYADHGTILLLKNRLLTERMKVLNYQEKAKNMTQDEKVRWVLNRYDSLPD